MSRLPGRNETTGRCAPDPGWSDFTPSIVFSPASRFWVSSRDRFSIWARPIFVWKVQRLAERHHRGSSRWPIPRTFSTRRRARDRALKMLAQIRDCALLLM